MAKIHRLIMIIGWIASLTACGDDGNEGNGTPPDQIPETCTEPTGECAPSEAIWIDVPGTTCMNGTTTGVGVRFNPEYRNTLIYLEPGGACFDESTCMDVFHPDGFGQTDFEDLLGGFFQADKRGVFNIQDQNNPFRLWNLVFIPYCSGDVHAGQTILENVSDAPREVATMKRFHQGHSNLMTTLEYLKQNPVSTSQIDATNVVEGLNQAVLAGSSAGGFGAVLNFAAVQEFFGDTPVHLINDSGPPMLDDTLPTCLQQVWRDTWDLDALLPQGCTDCFNANGGGLINLTPYLLNNYPNSRFALLSTPQDATIRRFFGYTEDSGNCVPSSLDGPTFEQGLRDSIAFINQTTSGRWHSYIETTAGAETDHVLLLPPFLIPTNLSSELATWLDAMINDPDNWSDSGL